MRKLYKDKIEVTISETREEMGRLAAKTGAAWLRKLLAEKSQVNCVFAAAPSQNEVLHFLCQETGIDWRRVNGFHMDEYVGLNPDNSASFAHFLTEKIFQVLPFGAVYLIHGDTDPQEECARYAQLLKTMKPDIVFLGIGENGHIAFNDPQAADFQDRRWVKIVELDQVCRMQQVHDGCFPDLAHVPKKALTVTIPALMSASYLCCVVPGKQKAEAVYHTLNGPISEECPASIMRNHDNVCMFLDQKSAMFLEREDASEAEND